MIELKIGKDEAEQRIDKFLRKHLHKASLAQIYKLLRTGKIRVNGKKVKQDYDLKLQDEVKIFLYAEDYKELTSEEPKKFKLTKVNFKVLYEDKDILIVDKPAGISMHEGSGITSHTLMDELHFYLKFEKKLSFRPAFVNRLDKWTSGIVIAGKTFEALKKLSEMMASGEVKKTYLLLVKGRPKQSGVISKKLLRTKMHHEIKVVVSEAGKEAVTKYKVIYQFKNKALVEAEILTGRTHQIRVHMASIGNPVVCDDVYGDAELNKDFRRKFRLRRQFLHSYKINLKHPINGKKIDIVSNLPGDLEFVLERLKI